MEDSFCHNFDVSDAFFFSPQPSIVSVAGMHYSLLKELQAFKINKKNHHHKTCSQKKKKRVFWGKKKKTGHGTKEFLTKEIQNGLVSRWKSAKLQSWISAWKDDKVSCHKAITRKFQLWWTKHVGFIEKLINIIPAFRHSMNWLQNDILSEKNEVKLGERKPLRSWAINVFYITYHGRLI